MKTRKITDCCKNAIGTVFLLGGAFLTCSTLMSMRSVWADPIAPMNGFILLIFKILNKIN